MDIRAEQYQTVLRVNKERRSNAPKEFGLLSCSLRHQSLCVVTHTRR